MDGAPEHLMPAEGGARQSNLLGYRVFWILTPFAGRLGAREFFSSP